LAFGDIFSFVAVDVVVVEGKGEGHDGKKIGLGGESMKETQINFFIKKE